MDFDETAAYAERAARTFVDTYLVNGTLGDGMHLSERERARTLCAWLAQIPARRLLACCWTAGDVEQATTLGVRPVVVLQNLADVSTAVATLESLPPGAYVYSHPRYSAVTFSTEVAGQLDRRRAPAGGKLCKVGLDEIRALRDIVGPEFELYDGRCRHVVRSLDAGADGVVAVPLAHLPFLKRPTLRNLQRVLNDVQHHLDAPGASKSDVMQRLWRYQLQA